MPDENADRNNRLKATMRERTDNLTGKGQNPTGCSSTKKIAAPQAKAEYAKSHPSPYQKR
jgi:hypothetical protein